MMHLHPLRMLQLVPELVQLEEMGYVCACNTHHGDSGWRISNDAKTALINDQMYDVKKSILESNIDFLIHAHRYVKDGMHCDIDGNIVKNVQMLMRRNNHLPIVRNLQQLAEPDRWFMLLMMTTLAVDEDEYVSTRDLEQILPGRTVRSIIRQIRQKQHLFAKFFINFPIFSGVSRGGGKNPLFRFFLPTNIRPSSTAFKRNRTRKTTKRHKKRSPSGSFQKW
jgi:hypothetical protein